VASELVHADVERRARAQRGLLKDHGQCAARKERITVSGLPVGLEGNRQVQQTLQLRRFDMFQRDKVTLH